MLSYVEKGSAAASLSRCRTLIFNLDKALACPFARRFGVLKTQLKLSPNTALFVATNYDAFFARPQLQSIHKQ